MWRLLKLETHNAYMNMAIDEAILNARIQNLVPNTLRLYRWKPSAVSIGRFQDVGKEVQIDNCCRLEVDIIRRMTGGGTVYHDTEDEITYSIIASKQDLESEDILGIYAKIYSGLREALRILCVKSDFNEGTAKTCPNLTINGRKISGSAQSHKKGIVIQHGTLLLNIDFERMFSLLRVPQTKTCYEAADLAKNRLTSITSELGECPSIETICNALTQGFQSAFHTVLEGSELSQYETDQADQLYREKYSTNDWNLHGRLIESERVVSR